MIKWFAYIVLLLLLGPRLSFAKGEEKAVLSKHQLILFKPVNIILTDTSSTKARRQQELEEKKKIKEIAKARRQPKPEKINGVGDAPAPLKTKPKRQRRPEGLERPPEIPRRNGN